MGIDEAVGSCETWIWPTKAVAPSPRVPTVRGGVWVLIIRPSRPQQESKGKRKLVQDS